MDLLEDIPALLNLSWAQIGAAASGVLALATLVYKFFSLQHQVHRLDNQVDDLRALNNQKVEVEGELRGKINDLNDRVHELTGERDAYKQSCEELQGRLASASKFDGRLWNRPIRTAPPDFVEPTERRTRFVSFANLKGGVGKTTLTANVGIALANQGKSVLLVDVDFQGSLTRLCTTQDTWTELLERGETIQTLLTSGPNTPPGWIKRLSHPVAGMPRGGVTCRVIGASEELAEAELQEEIRWFIEQEPDVRFAFRRLFHSPEILDTYDYVLFDCPPRLTTACVNAMACSDGVVIPIMLDVQSAAPIQYTVRQLSKLALLRAPSPIGIVANQVSLINGKLIGRQQDIWKSISEYLARSRMGPDQVFRLCVPSSGKIAEAANAGTIAALKPDVCKLFDGIAKHIERTFHHESVAVLQPA